MYGIVYIDHNCLLVSYSVPIDVGYILVLVCWVYIDILVLLFGIIPIVVHYCPQHVLAPIGIVIKFIGKGIAQMLHWYCPLLLIIGVTMV